MQHREQIIELEKWLRGQIIGQERLVNRLLTAILADGHLLVEGAPGLAKTKAIKTLGQGVEGEARRQRRVDGEEIGSSTAHRGLLEIERHTEQ